MKYSQKQCPICKEFIGSNNYNQHIKKCDGSYIKKVHKDKYVLDHDDLFCKFCHKECKSKNSLVQHELRCKENPNRKDFEKLTNYIRENVKGKNKSNCDSIAKQSETMKNKFQNGFISPCKGKHICFDYLYELHNTEEIDKWIHYIDSLNITFPFYETVNHGEYKIIRKGQTKANNAVKVLFEHNYIANLYLNNQLQDSNTVHHIDKNKQNNDIHNLLVFETWDDHKRFHNSKYAYLIYDEITHLFRCELFKTI